MNKIIVIGGYLATGKSAFAKILSQKFKTSFLSKDTIKEQLADDIGFNNRKENLQLSQVAIDLMLKIFALNAPSGIDWILESNFHSPEMIRISQLAKEYDYSILFIELKADIKILYERFTNRIEMGRHKAHLSGSFFDYEGFEKYLLQSQVENYTGRTLNIWADTFEYQTDNKILDAIQAFLND